MAVAKLTPKFRPLKTDENEIKSLQIAVMLFLGVSEFILAI